MEFSKKLGSNSGVSAQGGSWELQVRRSTAFFGEIPSQ